MSPRSSLVVLAAGVLALAGCAESTSSASDDAPLPTIGIGSELGGEVLAGADVRSSSNTAIDSVVMIGDSITVASAPALRAVYEQLGFAEISIQSKEGKRTALTFGGNPSGVDIASFIVSSADSGDDHSNELWIVALGTNDINQYTDSAERAGAINEMLHAVPDESPLIWVDTYFEGEPDGTDAINDIIADRVLDRGNSTIARWSAVAGDEGNLRNDGVHPREQGSEAFATVIGATIVDFLQLA